MTKKILIIGANGFIGSNLSTHILANKDWEIYAIDLASDKLKPCRSRPSPIRQRMSRIRFQYSSSISKPISKSCGFASNTKRVLFSRQRPKCTA